MLHFISSSTTSRLKEDEYSIRHWWGNVCNIKPTFVPCTGVAHYWTTESPVEGHKGCWTLQCTTTGQGKRICSNWRRVKKEQGVSNFLSPSIRERIMEKTSQPLSELHSGWMSCKSNKLQQEKFWLGAKWKKKSSPLEYLSAPQRGCGKPILEDIQNLMNKVLSNLA